MTKPKTTRQQANTNFRYRVAAFESRNGLNGRSPANVTRIGVIWAFLTVNYK